VTYPSVAGKFTDPDMPHTPPKLLL